MEFLRDFHSIEEAIKSKKQGVLYVSATGTRVKKIEHLAYKNRVKIIKCDKTHIEKMVGSDNRGIAFKIEESLLTVDSNDLQHYLKNFDKEKSTILILDSITDPHNFGAILRNSDKFGVDLVIYREKRAASKSDVVSSASAGAINYVKTIAVNNLNSAIENLKKSGFWIYGAEIAGKNLGDVEFADKSAIVLGSEGSGISKLTLSICDEILTIPTTGNIDSLNVSVASGIILYQRFISKN